MNVRRGFQRLFVAFGISWYILGALFVYDAWSSHYSRQKTDLVRCLAAVPQSKKYYDSEGRAIDLSAAGRDPGRWAPPTGYILDEPHRAERPSTPTAESCREAWVVAPTEERFKTAFVLLFPMVLYGIGKVLVWISKGFREEPPNSD